jgi:hypothetical protein
MKRFGFSVFCSMGALAAGILAAGGQTNASFTQTAAGVAMAGRAQVNNARPSRAISQKVGRNAVAISSRSSGWRPTQTVAQRRVNLRSHYSAVNRPLRPSLTAINARESARTYDVQSIQPVAEVLAKNDVAQTMPAPLSNPQRVLRRHDWRETRNPPAQEDITRSGSAIPDLRTDGKVRQPPADELSPIGAPQRKPQHDSHGDKPQLSYSEACRRHRQWRDRHWWDQNCTTIVFVNSGYYFLDAGYWYPALGYDPLNSYYDYDGPIYTYGNLLPDQVIANVQAALQDTGYYFGAVTGSLNVETRAALANFQRDYGLPITGAIDQPTVETLGLY